MLTLLVTEVLLPAIPPNSSSRFHSANFSRVNPTSPRVGEGIGLGPKASCSSKKRGNGASLADAFLPAVGLLSFGGAGFGF